MLKRYRELTMLMIDVQRGKIGITTAVMRILAFARAGMFDEPESIESAVRDEQYQTHPAVSGIRAAGSQT